ncbi:MAG: BatA domain-containing protein, partial [Parvibaculaceae bacterium]
MLQSLTFLTPWALAGLLALPVIWWLLRFTPPKPQHVRFPPLRLLLELVPREEQPDKTPWWLMLLRLALAGLLILAVAHPFLSPTDAQRLAGNPLLIVVDDSWAAAKDWDARLAVLQDVAASAQQAGVPVAVATTSPIARATDLNPQAAQEALSRITALQPKALQPDRLGLIERLKQTYRDGAGLNIVWLSDGLDHGSTGAFAQGLLSLAGGRASLEVIAAPAGNLPLALAAPQIEGGRMKITALQSSAGRETKVAARALAANGRSLAETTLTLAPGAGHGEGFIDLPLELRNEVERVELSGERSAAAVYLLDDRWRRKTVSLMSGSALESAQPLLSPLYYVSRALEPYTEISEPKQISDLKNQLDAGLSVLALADIGVLPQDEQDMISGWIERGGLLLRFAGPRMAAAQDPLIPVTLREGGRALGSALSWETPQALQPFPETSPFAGLALDASVVVNRQVLAEPAADLTPKVWASLADGTPLVTAERRGKGIIVLFHVPANADWSNLPL